MSPFRIGGSIGRPSIESVWRLLYLARTGGVSTRLSRRSSLAGIKGGTDAWIACSARRGLGLSRSMFVRSLLMPGRSDVDATKFLGVKDSFDLRTLRVVERQ